MGVATRSYGGESGEERVLRRRIALVQATMAVSAELGWRQVSIDRICQQAGLNKRYFYESFVDLEALAAAVVDHVYGGVVAALSAVVDLRNGNEVLAHTVIGALVRYITEEPVRARLLFGELMSSDAAESHRKQAVRGIAAEVVRVARAVHQGQDSRDPIVETAASFMLGGTGQAVLAWLDGEIDGSREDLIGNLSFLWLVSGDSTAAEVRRRMIPSGRKKA